MLKNCILVLLLVISFTIYSQNKYPEDYFRSPLEVPIILSGTFGELRNNHFHSGIDIKTQGKEGLKIYAAAEGYISRIKVAQYGFGKAIYITHPNGYTTVYAHLSKYANAIEKYVKNIQYKKEKYQTGNIYFKENEWTVKKGEVIAFSGDTGGSGGPHLHYEIRNTRTENIINPLLFGINVEDTKAPTIQGLKVYAINSEARVNNQNKSFSLPIKNIGNGNYVADRVSANGEIGFSISVFDRLNKAPNKNGIYSLEMLVNEKRHYYHKVETFAFSESKFINLHIDYPYYKTYKKRYQKTHIDAVNSLSTYKDLINNGKINIIEGLNYTVKIIATDLKGNKSTVKIPIIGKASNAIFTKQQEKTDYKIIAKNFQRFTQKNVTIAFPKNTFYNDVYINFKVSNGIAKVHTPTLPLDKKFTLTFNVANYSEAEKKQLYIANLEYPKYPRYQNTRKKDSTFFTTTKSLGSYKLLKDTQKPTIKLLYFKDKQWLSNAKTLKVKINDVGAGIKNYRATIDNEWILMEYNHKKKVLTYNFSDKKLVGSKHIFKIVVSDNVGNTKVLSATFYKKQVN